MNSAGGLLFSLALLLFFSTGFVNLPEIDSRADPTNQTLLLLNAKNLLEEGKNAQAVALLSSIRWQFDLPQIYPIAQLLLTRVELSTGQPDLAKERLVQLALTAPHPLYKDYLYLKACANYQEGNDSLATKLFYELATKSGTREIHQAALFSMLALVSTQDGQRTQQTSVRQLIEEKYAPKNIPGWDLFCQPQLKK